MEKKMVLSWMEESFGEILGGIFALRDEPTNVVCGKYLRKI